MKKICSRCLDSLDLSSFYKDPKGSNGYKAECKQCLSLRRKQYYLDNPDKLKRKNELDKNRYHSMPPEKKEQERLRKLEWSRKNKEYYYERSQTEKYKRKRRIRLKELRTSSSHHRAKMRRDKCIRRSREKDAGSLQISSIVALENYNLINFRNANYFTCEICLKIIKESYHLEHLIPLSCGGSNKLHNLAISCSKCNLQKSNKTLEEYNIGRLAYFNERKIQ